MSKKRVVIALGHKALGNNLPEQKVSVQNTARIIADIIQDGCQVAVVHSNAPQVGMIHTAMNEFGKAHPNYTVAPMSVCSAMSQGYIGYDLQNGIREELLKRGIYKTVSTLLTQVTVNPYDDSFYKPVKVIGRYMTAEEAEEETKKGNFVIEEPARGFRRIVAAPKPISIVEIDAIQALLGADQIVIACGGGGIPVMEQDYHLKGASAVIEKDLASGLLAKEIGADILILLTGVEKVCLNYRTPKETTIDTMTIEEGKGYIAEGHFESASMLPKIEAAIDFIMAGNNRTAIITTMEKAMDALNGKAGTIIR